MEQTQENQDTQQPASSGCCGGSKKETKPQVDVKKEAKPSCCATEKSKEQSTEK